MAKEKNLDIWSITKKVATVIILLGAAGAVCHQALNFFARAKAVAIIDQRLILNTSRDNVHDKEDDLQWTQQQVAFERRNDPKTPREEEFIKKAEAKLAEVKARHEKRVEAFEKEFGQPVGEQL